MFSEGNKYLVSCISNSYLVLSILLPKVEENNMYFIVFTNMQRFLFKLHHFQRHVNYFRLIFKSICSQMYIKCCYQNEMTTQDTKRILYVLEATLKEYRFFERHPNKCVLFQNIIFQPNTWVKLV